MAATLRLRATVMGAPGRCPRIDFDHALPIGDRGRNCAGAIVHQGTLVQQSTEPAIGPCIAREAARKFDQIADGNDQFAAAEAPSGTERAYRAASLVVT